MIVVSDTTPIISLLKINRLNSLEERLLTAEEIQQSILELIINGRHISDRLFAQLLDRIRFLEQETD